MREKEREREQQAEAVGNKDHFVKNIPMCRYFASFFFKAVASSASTAVYSSFSPTQRAPLNLKTQACGHSKLLLWHLSEP